MYAAVSGSASTSFWSRGLARIRGSRLSTSANKTPSGLDKVVAAEVAAIAACKAPLKEAKVVPRLQIVRVYRWNPETPQVKPYMQQFSVDLNKCGTMVLDVLTFIKAQHDPTLSFRRSCREGICGCCAMNIDGVNTLACITKAKESPQPLVIYPLPHAYVIRDLIPDMEQFLGQFQKIDPYLKRPGEDDFLGMRQILQSPRDRSKLDGLYECIMCACCTYSCPPYWWLGDKYLGPAVLLQGLNPGKAIAQLKRLLAGLAKKEKPDLDTALPNPCYGEEHGRKE
ncbi:Succinate dehydrogenase [ubiquinone] iron-sulfur subunit, mitochondrial [Temnothorax longispinosus]|uniref:Succinate dehydrogenase [ubiquinone] iron-sulfur subunit, mitochondrial n=1 Tax=Temnothorax longispinosus TaxID=300112 RepID=A0A4S2KXL5_9HYME|nr:Succinate dehydrogenase [ubiquinone] iron-sulfur subunit, mitochondrial [Temnothorax longispinosus]